MDLFAFPPLAALLDLAYAGFTGLADILAPLAGASAAAAAIVVVTLLVRTVLVPVGISQARAEQTRARLAPRLRELQKRFRNDRERLQREMMQLYRDEGTSPFAGCLPVLLQAPVLGLVYAVFLHPTIAGHANTLLVQTVAGVPLGATPVGMLFAGTLDPAAAFVCGGLVAAIVVFGELTRRFLRAPVPPREEGSPAPVVPVALLEILPFATAAVALFVPLAAGLYLLVTVAWTFAQRLVLRRLYPLQIG